MITALCLISDWQNHCGEFYTKALDWSKLNVIQPPSKLITFLEGILKLNFYSKHVHMTCMSQTLKWACSHFICILIIQHRLLLANTGCLIILPLADGEVDNKWNSHFIKASHLECRVLLDRMPKQMVWSMRCSALLGFSIRRLWWSLHGVEKPSMPSTPHTFLLLQARSIQWFYYIELTGMTRAVCSSSASCTSLFNHVWTWTLQYLLHSISRFIVHMF